MENPQRNALLGDIIDIDAGKMYGLFKDWYERTAELGNEPTDKPYNHYCLVCDGITRKREKDSTRAVDEAITEMAWEKDKKRVAFLIKDENQKGSIWADDTRNWLVQTPADDTADCVCYYGTWSNIALLQSGQKSAESTRQAYKECRRNHRKP